MPGRRRSSFRSGDLAEHLGLLLLKGIAAVAEVARPEDVGLDAIATLKDIGVEIDPDNLFGKFLFALQQPDGGGAT
ncbi:MAG: hypothetical protein GXX96_03150 [Planctomycetaceae bacterium]|jgi:hypothetical protein|nr:hypothetical protein [Planctomycetaceae bacterium]